MRYTSGTDPADNAYTYTGQRQDSYINLLWYGSRWYDPQLGHFLSPDSIVPDKGNPQGLDRYAFVANNPIKYVDPGGHCWGIFSFVRGIPTYNTTCENIDMALTIIQSDQTTTGQKAGAIAYIGAEGLAHTAIVVGSAACLSNVAACVAGAKTALGIGGVVTEAACADGDCSNELKLAIKLGGKAVEGVSDLNKIVSQLMSRGKADLLGIKVSGNMGDLMNPQVQKALNTINSISSNPTSRIWKGTWMGREVYEYVLNGVGVVRDRITGELISVVSRTGADLQKLQDFVDNGTAEWLR